MVRWAPPFEQPAENVIQRLARQAEHVPAEVELGYHLCYGDYQHRHFVEPRDLPTCVTMANAICTSAGRPVDWIHMPVPIERDDDDYFAPLSALEVQPDTEVYRLGALPRWHGRGPEAHRDGWSPSAQVRSRH